MKRYLLLAALVPLAALGCGGNEQKEATTLPSANDMFDKSKESKESKEVKKKAGPAAS